MGNAMPRKMLVKAAQAASERKALAEEADIKTKMEMLREAGVDPQLATAPAFRRMSIQKLSKRINAIKNRPIHLAVKPRKNPGAPRLPKKPDLSDVENPAVRSVLLNESNIRDELNRLKPDGNKMTFMEKDALVRTVARKLMIMARGDKGTAVELMVERGFSKEFAERLLKKLR
jgi:hypothetical protein